MKMDQINREHIVKGVKYDIEVTYSPSITEKEYARKEGWCSVEPPTDKKYYKTCFNVTITVETDETSQSEAMFDKISDFITKEIDLECVRCPWSGWGEYGDAFFTDDDSYEMIKKFRKAFFKAVNSMKDK